MKRTHRVDKDIYVETVLEYKAKSLENATENSEIGTLFRERFNMSCVCQAQVCRVLFCTDQVMHNNA